MLLSERLLNARTVDESEIRARLDQMSRDLAARGLDAYVPDWGEFSRAARNSTFNLFDPAAWSRRIFYEEEIDF